jgi:hypothetical protein
MLRSPSCIAIAALSLLLWASPGFGGIVAGQKASGAADPSTPLGILVGNVDIEESEELLAPPRVLLMSSSWTELWSGTLQQTLDAYLMRYRRAVDRDRDAYHEIAGWAYGEAVGSVTLRMQEALGEDFSNWFKEADGEGRFEFPRIPLGDYQVVAVAATTEGALIWSEAVTVSSAIPQYIEVQNRVP